MQLNLAQINQAINAAFDMAVDRLKQELDQAITADIYEWPRTTVRSDRSVATSPRDIVDTGALLDAGTVIRTGDTATYEWDLPYATAVHDGATLSTGTELPGRPWTEVALQDTKVVEVFSTQLGKRL